MTFNVSIVIRKKFVVDASKTWGCEGRSHEVGCPHLPWSEEQRRLVDQLADGSLMPDVIVPTEDPTYPAERRVLDAAVEDWIARRKKSDPGISEIRWTVISAERDE